MLYLWSGAEAQTIRKVFQPVISRNDLPHKVIPFPESREDVFPIPQIGKGDVLLACGSKARNSLEAAGLIKKKTTVGHNREKPILHNHGHIFLTYDPGMANIDYARVPEMQWDCELAIRLHKTGTTAPVIGQYVWVESFHELIEEIDRRYEATGKPVYMAWDTETMGKDEYAPGVQVLSITFTIDEGKSFMMYFEKGEVPREPPPWKDPEGCDYWEGVWCQINWLLTTEKARTEAANGKYDNRWTNQHWAINCTNDRFDTLLVGSLLDENRSNSLKLHAKIMTPLGGYENGMDKYDMAHLEVVPKDAIGQYMGGDSDATHRVAKIMRKELVRDKALANFYTKLVHPASRVFEKMERTGICVDIDYYDRLETKLEAEQARLQAEMKALCPKKLLAKYSDNFSFTRPVIIKDLFFSPTGYNLKPKMYTEKAKEQTNEYASTSNDHLMMFGDVPEAQAFVKLLAELNSANKTMSTYVRGFRKHLRSDGRFHPSYMLFKGDYGDVEDSGADTGRCLTEDALILTDKGQLPIAEVVARGELGESFKVLTHKNRWLPVTGFYRNGPKPVCKVRVRGRELTATYNHPFMSFPSWKNAGDLKTGHWLYLTVDPPPAEEWKAIPEWPFEVSNMGQVRRAIDGNGTKAGTIVKQRPKGKWGHLQVSLTSFEGDRCKIDVPVHKLVVDAFVPNKGGVEIAHLNGDASCNWVTNLKWVSVEENKLHQRLHGTYNREIQKKITWNGVDRIHAGEWSCDTDAAATLGVSRELARDIRLGKRWNGRRDQMVGFQPSRVDSVIYDGIQETYDLTVGEDHSFVANGIVVHNTSAKDPAVQTIPKHTIWTKWLRRAFVAPPGHTILQLDFSQGELRIAACLANEPTMLEAYLQNKDLHAVTGAKLAGYEFEDFMLLPESVRDPFRSQAKPANFGLLYGMGAEGYQAYALSSYGVKLTLEQAEQARNEFFELYDRLLPWHDEYKRRARQWESVRSPLGRIRHLPLINSRDRQAASKAGRNAVNSPVQSCLSDMMQYAMVLMDREYPQLQLCLMTHDSIAIYVPVDEATIWAKRLKSIMDNLPLKKEFGWDHQLPFIADAEVAVEPAYEEPYLLELNDGVRSLATLKKLKVFA